jgi:hypothetical protein
MSGQLKTMEDTMKRVIKNNADLVEAINELVAYNWADEEHDFKQQCRENPEGTRTHIFHILRALNNWSADWYREGTCDDTYWRRLECESVIDDAATVAGFLGLDINQTAYKTMGGETRYKPTVYFSGFWSQGDGACVEGTWRASDVKVDKLKEYAPQDKELHRIVDGLAELAKEYPDGYFKVKHRGHYSHSGCTAFDVELPTEQEDELEYDSPEYKAVAGQAR